MRDFDKALYEATLVAFGKVLAKYNVFAQAAMMREVARDMVEYLRERGMWFEERGGPEDMERVVEFFMQGGFAKHLEVKSADRGQFYIWHDLFLFDAYKYLQDVTDNPFLSCPLNLCLTHVSGEQGKAFKLLSRKFDPQQRITVSQWEVVDRTPDTDVEAGFDPLVIENARLFQVPRERGGRACHECDGGVPCEHEP
jgi:hypothetical protein